METLRILIVIDLIGFILMMILALYWKIIVRKNIFKRTAFLLIWPISFPIYTFRILRAVGQIQTEHDENMYDYD